MGSLLEQLTENKFFATLLAAAAFSVAGSVLTVAVLNSRVGAIESDIRRINEFVDKGGRCTEYDCRSIRGLAESNSNRISSHNEKAATVFERLRSLEGRVMRLEQ